MQHHLLSDGKKKQLASHLLDLHIFTGLTTLHEFFFEITEDCVRYGGSHGFLLKEAAKRAGYTLLPPPSREGHAAFLRKHGGTRGISSEHLEQMRHQGYVAQPGCDPSKPESYARFNQKIPRAVLEHYGVDENTVFEEFMFGPFKDCFFYNVRRSYVMGATARRLKFKHWFRGPKGAAEYLREVGQWPYPDPDARPSPMPGYVYLAHSTEKPGRYQYKIGHSKRPYQRVEAQLLYNAELIHQFEASNRKAAEKELHDTYCRERESMRSEWFDLSIAQVEAIKRIEMV